jgi:hypothetical protein
MTDDKPVGTSHAAIASSVHTMRPRGGGLCLARAIDGRDVLAHAGVRARIFLGGMLYRSSWGVHRFCDPDNIARGRAHHCWLETATGDLIDFSLVDYDWMWPRTYLWAAAAPVRAAMATGSGGARGRRVLVRTDRPQGARDRGITNSALRGVAAPRLPDSNH